MGNSIKPHLETAKKTGACQLSKSNLLEFPPELLKLAQMLRTLDMSQNKISSIPPSIKSLINLKNFTMNNNRLSALPEEFCQLKKLEAISLNFNNLTCLPTSFNQLSALKTLSLSNNRISQFPLGLCSLKHLDAVDLSHNKICDIPDGISELQVTELNLNQNQIKSVSERIQDCPRLKVLRLDENCLHLSTISPVILRDSAISLLSVEGNVFTAKELHEAAGWEQYMERYTATRRKMD